MKRIANYYFSVCAYLSRTFRNERGQGLIEYSLILILIAVVVLVMLQKVGLTTNSSLCKVDAAIAAGS